MIDTVTQDEMDAGRLQKVFDIAVGPTTQLPAAFDEPVAIDLIRRAANRQEQPASSLQEPGSRRRSARWLG